MRLKDLVPADYNPRTIGREALRGLKASLRSFGDISGVVFNRRTGNLVAGHQRVRALAEEHGDDLQVFQEGQEGRIKLPDGGHVRVRYVDWDEATEKAANVAANNPHIQGDWVQGLDQVLRDVELELPELSVDLRLDMLTASPARPSDHAAGVGGGGPVPAPRDEAPPDGFKEFDEESVTTEHTCPMCGFQF